MLPANSGSGSLRCCGGAARLLRSSNVIVRTETVRSRSCPTGEPDAQREVAGLALSE